MRITGLQCSLFQFEVMILLLFSHNMTLKHVTKLRDLSSLFQFLTYKNANYLQLAQSTLFCSSLNFKMIHFTQYSQNHR